MKTLVWLFGVLFLACRVSSDGDSLEEKDGVLILTGKNFDTAMKKYKALLVHFYLTERPCPICEHLNQEFVDSAKMLLEEGEENIRVGTVDISKEVDLPQRFGVSSVTVKFFKRSEDPDDPDPLHGVYIGSRHSHNMVAWLLKKSGQSAYRKLHNLEEIEEFSQDNDASVVGVFKDPEGKEAKAFIAASQRILDDGVNFGLVVPDTAMLQKEFAGSNQTAKIYIIKHEDELLVVYNDKPYDNVEEIVRFVRVYAFPYVIEFTPDAEGVQKTFGNTIVYRHCSLFASRSSDDFQDIYDEFRRTARRLREEFNHKLTFVYVDTDAPENQRWIHTFGIDRAKELPLVTIAVLERGRKRYNLKRKLQVNGQLAPITSEAIEKLIRDLFSSNLDSFKDEL